MANLDGGGLALVACVLDDAEAENAGKMLSLGIAGNQGDIEAVSNP